MVISTKLGVISLFRLWIINLNLICDILIASNIIIRLIFLVALIPLIMVLVILISIFLIILFIIVVGILVWRG